MCLFTCIQNEILYVSDFRVAHDKEFEAESMPLGLYILLKANKLQGLAFISHHILKAGKTG